MRERGDLRGHSMLRQGARDLLFPYGGPNQSFMKSIRLSQLEAYPLDRVAKIRRGCPLAECVQYAPLMRREIVGRTRRKPLQQTRVARLCLGNAPFPLRRRGGRIEAQYLVDQAEIPIVVEQALVGGDFRVDANPEAHIALELRGVDEGIGCFHVCGAAVTQRSQQ